MSRSKKNWDFLVNYEGNYLNIYGQGLKGETGRKGEKGEKGNKGLKGVKGTTGYKGDKGAKGERGVRGFKGNQGNPSPIFDFRGVVNNLQELQNQPAILGHVWMVGYDGDTNNSLWTYSGFGSVWVKVTDTTTELKGDPGVPGINGEDGEDGDKGEKGTKGEEGDKGEKGAKGEDGQDGIDGQVVLFTTYPELPTNQLP